MVEVGSNLQPLCSDRATQSRLARQLLRMSKERASTTPLGNLFWKKTWKNRELGQTDPILTARSKQSRYMSQRLNCETVPTACHFSTIPGLNMQPEYAVVGKLTRCTIKCSSIYLNAVTSTWYFTHICKPSRDPQCTTQCETVVKTYKGKAGCSKMLCHYEMP